ncbi:Vesicular glutamate transporter 3 [Fragariocoptes setiger]|uniref:Vesicular glutamate transporter 3 n=1 Tax=Fragariocoptes setiger TaxID=1670756 RepID=A0ABQ7SAA9_9ACAR|nr:Vesicular glutamate transporter 3 [Fragariocoptes setiger]
MDDHMRHFSRAGSFSGEIAYTLSKRHRQSVRSALSRQSKVSEVDAVTGIKQNEEETYELPSKLINGRKWYNGSFHQLRWVVILLSGLGASMMMFLRLNITVAIIKMANQTQLYLDENPGESADYIALGDEVEVPQITLARVAERYGAFKVMSISHFISLVATALIPYFVYYGWPYIVALRMLIGVAAAPIMPINMIMISKWIPPMETHIALTKEARYILSQRSDGDTDDEDSESGKENESQRGVWRKIITSTSLYTYIFVWAAYAGVGGAFIFVLPMYLRQVVKIDIKQNGILTFLIQSMSLLSYLWASPVLTLLVPVIVSAVTWILPTYFDGISVIMFMINRAFFPVAEIVVIGSILCEYTPLGVTGTVFSAINTVGNFMSVPITYGIGYILDNANEDEKCWNWIFIFFAGFNMLSLIAFNTLIKTEPAIAQRNSHKPSVGSRAETLDTNTLEGKNADPKI